MSSRSARSPVRIVLAILVIGLGSLLTTGPAAAKAAGAQCPAGVKVAASDSPATVTVSGTPVLVTITGTTFTIASADQGTTLEDANWCLKASTSTQSGSSTTGTSTITNKKGQAQKISYVVIHDVEVDADDPTCWDSSLENWDDVRYLGPANTKDNIIGFSSRDGTCSSEVSATAMVVQAPDADAALALCQEADPGIQVTSDRTLNELGYAAAPADSWFCFSGGGH